LSRCPSCDQPYSHEDGHLCPVPAQIWVLFRRSRNRKSAQYTPFKTFAQRPSLTKAAMIKIYENMQAKFPQFEFLWKPYIAD
jgi:hypothetical protein